LRSDEEILAELGRAAEGLWYMSESDYPLVPVRVEGPDEPSHARLRELAGAGADARVETGGLEDFFADSAAVRMPVEGSGEPARAASFRGVVRALEQNLSDLRVYRVGEVNIPVYVLGRGRSGDWLGLSTRVVET
jgi:hypothetical protein